MQRHTASAVTVLFTNTRTSWHGSSVINELSFNSCRYILVMYDGPTQKEFIKRK